MLDQTPKQIVERKALRINPARTCQPIGAMYAALGIHNCIPHSHGSQGCCAYHRSHLTRHYKEPVMAASSSFTEGSSVFGGAANLTEAIQNIFALYKPDVIAVHTTCLSETIGDDLAQITRKARDEGKVPADKHVIYCNTPSYVGSHITGFARMAKAMAAAFAKSSGKTKNQVNIVPGFVEPSDMREIKRLCAEMGVPAIVFPDTSDVLDAPQTGEHVFYPKGGVTVEQLSSTADSIATLALGRLASEPAGKELETKFNVCCETLDLPIGLSATDRFIDALRNAAGVAVPDSITDDRGRLLDIICDQQQYFHGKRAAIFGDPDHLVSLAEFLSDIGMKPVFVLTGTPGEKFETLVRDILKEAAPEAKVKAFADLFLLHQWIKNEPVDLLIGNTYGKYIARAEDTPFVRFGFPVLDRIGHSYFPTVGYRGGMRLLEKILDALHDRQDRDCDDEMMELVM